MGYKPPMISRRVRRGHHTAVAAVLLLGCASPPPSRGGFGTDAAVDAGEFSLCTRGCPEGSVCVGFRCVSRGDAGGAPLADVGAPVDTGPPPPTGHCCPLDPPSCGCVRVGGPVPPSGVCPRLCNIGFHEQWRRVTDPRSNCPAWSWLDLPCTDAGPASDAPEAGAAADAATEGDAAAP